MDQRALIVKVFLMDPVAKLVAGLRVTVRLPKVA